MTAWIDQLAAWLVYWIIGEIPQPSQRLFETQRKARLQHLFHWDLGEISLFLSLIQALTSLSDSYVRV